MERLGGATMPRLTLTTIADKALTIACVLYVYRRGNAVPLDKRHFAAADRYFERDAKACAKDAVDYGTALADEIRGLL